MENNINELYLRTVKNNIDNKNAIASNFFIELCEVIKNNSKVLIIKYGQDDKVIQRLEGDITDWNVIEKGDIGVLEFEFQNNGKECNYLECIVDINKVELGEMKFYRFEYKDNVVLFRVL